MKLNILRSSLLLVALLSSALVCRAEEPDCHSIGSKEVLIKDGDVHLMGQFAVRTSNFWIPGVSFDLYKQLIIAA